MHYYTGKFDQSKDNIVLLATNLVWWVESSFHLFKEFYSEKGKELKTAFIIHWKGLNWYHNVSLKQPLYKPKSSDFFTCSNNKSITVDQNWKTQVWVILFIMAGGGLWASYWLAHKQTERRLLVPILRDGRNRIKNRNWGCTDYVCIALPRLQSVTQAEVRVDMCKFISNVLPPMPPDPSTPSPPNLMYMLIPYVSPLGRSENQKSQKIKNGECFFCVLVYKEQGELQLV